MPTPARKWKGRISTLLASLALALVAGECLCRTVFSERLGYVVDERNLSYGHDDRLGWFPIPGSRFELRGARTVSVQHNSRGFRDREHGPKRGPRLACLGDSFTWGYDAEREERFTEHLQGLLPAWDVLNLGVSGYGTDQALMVLQDTFDEYQPDVVLLVFTHTDVEDNASNVRYGGYYKPWFELEGGGLVQRGVPVPESENYYFARSSLLRSSYFLRAVVRVGLRAVHPRPVRAAAPHERTFALLASMREFVEAGGAAFVVGLESGDPRVAEFLATAGFLHLDLSDVESYPDHGNHWTPAGHVDVAGRIRRFLDERQLLEEAGR